MSQTLEVCVIRFHSVYVLQSLSFREHIEVPASVTQPVIKCEVSFMADSGELAHQVVTIHTVPVTTAKG